MRARRFAEGTSVAPEKSRLEIETLLRRTGATGFASGWGPDDARIMFQKDGRHVRFVLKMPTDRDVVKRAAEERRRWRTLLLVIKAKLEAVASQVTTFEEEFLAHIVLPGGETVGERIASQLVDAYKTGAPPLLLGSGDVPRRA